MIERNRLRELGTERLPGDAAPSNSEYPKEAFACPACGQMLAPSCRVCVACQKPIDVTKIKRAVSPPGAPDSQAARRLVAPVRFSWGIFFCVLILWFLAALIVQRLLGPVKGQWAMGGAVILSSAWVFRDARRQGVPKPLRWGLGSLLLWILFFPWYLARRRTPEAPCPFVEGEVRPLTLALLLILMLFFLASAVAVILSRPPR